MTNDLLRRVNEHRWRLHPESFTARYRCYRLVYHDESPYVLNAIEEEKRIKNLSRKKKEQLISSMNPEWRDFAKDWPNQ
jgi:putative endonuclease